MSVKTPIYEDPVYTVAPEDDPFGPILSGFEIEQAIAGVIRTWMPDFLAEVESRRNVAPGTHPTFKTQVPTSYDANRLREDQLPALAIVSQGTLGVPEVFNSDGSYTARWQVDCYSVCTARGNRQARRLAQWYAAAVRAILIEWDFSGTDLNLIRIDWLGERYATRDPSDERTYGEGIVQVAVHAIDVIRRHDGPMPMFKPGGVGPLPKALSQHVTVVPITEMQEE
jgi:hypothetical protein